MFLQNWFLIQEKEKLPNFVCLIKRLPFTNEADNKIKPYEAEKKQEPINICFGKNKPQKLLIHDLRCGNKQNQDEKPIHHASSRYTRVWSKKDSYQIFFLQNSITVYFKDKDAELEALNKHSNFAGP